MFTPEKIQIPFFLTLFGLLLIFSFVVFLPYFNIIVLAVVLSITLYPVYSFCLKIFRNNETISAFVAVAIVILAVLLPAMYIGYYLFDEGKNLYGHVVFDQSAIISFLQNKFHVSVPSLDGATINNYIQQALGWISSNINSLFSNALGLFVDIFILICSLYFLFKNGKDIIKKIVILSPLKDEHDRQILNKIYQAVNSITRGYFFVAVIHSTILIGLGFAIFGVPNPVLWGLISVVVSFIPVFGTGLIIAPALIYLAIYGSFSSLIGLAIWYLVFMFIIDNFITPFLLKRGMKINSTIMLLSVLGGLSFFGPIGLLVGPLIISTLFALIEIYPLIIKKEIKAS